jgi:hypothetical protein
MSNNETAVDVLTARQVLTAWAACNAGATVIDHDDTWGQYPADTCPCTVEEFAAAWTANLGSEADQVQCNEDGEPISYPWPEGIIMA